MVFISWAVYSFIKSCIKKPPPPPVKMPKVAPSKAWKARELNGRKWKEKGGWDSEDIFIFNIDMNEEINKEGANESLTKD